MEQNQRLFDPAYLLGGAGRALLSLWYPQIPARSKDVRHLPTPSAAGKPPDHARVRRTV